MNTPPPRTALITGASSGIGAGLAREFSRAGWGVALVARRLEKLEVVAGEIRAAGGRASVHRGDVTDAGAIAAVIEELGRQGIVPAIVVANAGFGVFGKAQDLTLEDYQRQFDTNVYGVIRTLHETLPALQIVWSRQLGLLVAVLVLLAVRGRALLRTGHPVIQVSRGVLVISSSILFIVAVGYVPLADAVAVSFVAPLVVTILGAIVHDVAVPR